MCQAIPDESNKISAIIGDEKIRQDFITEKKNTEKFLNFSFLFIDQFISSKVARVDCLRLPSVLMLKQNLCFSKEN